MIRLVGRRLIIPQGDTGALTIPTLGNVSAGDKAILSIFDNLKHITVCTKEIPATPNTLEFNFVSNDTLSIEPDERGGRYTWDVTILRNPSQNENNETSYESIDSYYAAYKLPQCLIKRVTRNVQE